MSKNKEFVIHARRDDGFNEKSAQNNVVLLNQMCTICSLFIGEKKMSFRETYSHGRSSVWILKLHQHMRTCELLRSPNVLFTRSSRKKCFSKSIS